MKCIFNSLPGWSLCAWLWMALATSCGTSGSNEITLASLLDDMTSYVESARYPAILYTSHLESSRDRRSVSPDSAFWFANKDGYGFIRTDSINGRKENVLFDQSGPGVITRIWLTTMTKEGKLRFYFDQATEAQWEIPAYDLMRTGLDLGDGLVQAHTSYTPDGKGGNTLYLPIPYANGCRITFELPDSMEVTPKYYLINYRKYPVGTAIKTFSTQEVEKNRKKIEQTNELLLSHPAYTKGEELSSAGTIEPENSMILDLPAGEKAIHALSFDLSMDTAHYEQIMRQVMLQIDFDGVQTVSIPLGDFSGAGMGAPVTDSWFLTSNGKGKIDSRWVMPYQKGGKITLINRSPYPVDATVTLRTDNWKWDNRSLYFHTSWKQENGIPVTTQDLADNNADCSEWNFATLSGRGVYKGDVLSLFNNTPAWYGEGDEKIWIDNDTFPSHFGTGTEDYYNCSWAPVVPFYTPFGGAPRADSETSTGYNTFFRTRNLDAIPFRENLRFDIEMISWISGTVDYSTTIYWYGDINASAAGTTPLEEALRPLPVQPADPAKFKLCADAIEFEDLVVTDKSKNLQLGEQAMFAFAPEKWSEGKQLIITGGKPGDYVVYVLDAPEKRPYHLTLYGTKASDFGVLRFTVNRKTLDLQLDEYSTDRKVTSTGPVYLGSFMPENGKIELKISIAGTNKDSQGNRYFAGLDCVRIATSK